MKITSIIGALACAAIVAGCGSGSGGGTDGKIKKNGILGALPALYDTYNADEAETEKGLEEQSNKLMAGGEKNYDKVQKLFDDQAAKVAELKKKFEADVKAELAKVVGKEVPVTFSQKLDAAGMHYFDVTDAAIVEHRGEPQIGFKIKAREDFKIPSMKAYDYTIFYRLTGQDGATLQNSVSAIIPVPLAREEKSFAGGDILTETQIPLNLSRFAADRATLTGVEFISKEEYDALSAK